MTKKILASDHLRRRNFLASALAGGAIAVCTGKVSGMSNVIDSPKVCGELSPADPLYLYKDLVWRLEGAATKLCQDNERKTQDELFKKVEEIWKVSDKLKATIYSQSKVYPAVERVNSLAYIGHTNVQVGRASLKVRSQEVLNAHVYSQEVITAEIAKASLDLSKQGEKVLSAAEWELLKQLIGLIDDVKTTYQPAVVNARFESDKCRDSARKTISTIENALMSASTSLIKGDKQDALKNIVSVLKELDTLPSAPDPVENSPKDLKAAEAADKSELLPEFLTRDQFRKMIEPIKDLVDTGRRFPVITQNGKQGFSLTPTSFIVHNDYSSPDGFFDPISVREIVRSCFTSGHWLQVVAVTAACLPLWGAYTRSEERKCLIYSALCAVPRGKSRLWEAAFYLNNLTS